MVNMTALICTRNRPQQCREAVESVLALLHADNELIVVDQGDQAPVTDLGERVTLIRSESRGLSAARNEGCERARGGLLLFTDDDCTVDPGWLAAWHGAFESTPGAVIGFGRVVSAPFDVRLGFTPTFEPQTGLHNRELFLRGAGHVGMGANFAVRRSAWRDAGGFDEVLGSGKTFPAGEEVDLAYRLSRAGHPVLHTADPVVVHHGYRHHLAAYDLLRGYMFGTAGAYMKHVRCGDVYAARLLLLDLGLHAADVFHKVGRTRKPGFRGLANHLSAIPTSFRWSIEPETRLYQSP